ncbi:hypothetical protein CONCODRAFT_16634 [Conidiobolus coronatus NRRL 28638]|uniref:intramembrane prenyl-peptidase Rce1 n=1 Tax=Conidiobolus coronatus (strain ATCC 28846 / CBS 209.66 / NRRL 28638) TaxID=796925 RepID=A0A137P9Y5_CONC2|nr:hypothetical protein CONCODRAFT_16634 [Conidiobolus coronatus NRRL 28638]|eukprot:KXN71818.1 hypothetical protein CONCODRAFT_16634 [Conidiobolus coronatus NRRL 28638]
MITSGVSALEANKFAIINSLLFVLTFYLIPKRYSILGRDNPKVIKFRLICTLLVGLTSIILGYYKALELGLFSRFESKWSSYKALFKLLGFQIPNLVYTLKPLYLTVIVYLGNLLELYFMNQLPFQAHFYWKFDFVNVILSWIGFRNYIWGPFIEELVFRSCNMLLFQFTNLSTFKKVSLTALYFGLAHVHHGFELYRKGEPINKILIITAFQFSFTSLFGSYCSFSLLKTKSVYGPILSHIFCNVMGLPTLPDETLSKSRRQLIISIQLISLPLFIISLIYL